MSPLFLLETGHFRWLTVTLAGKIFVSSVVAWTVAFFGIDMLEFCNIVSKNVQTFIMYFVEFYAYLFPNVSDSVPPREIPSFCPWLVPRKGRKTVDFLWKNTRVTSEFHQQWWLFNSHHQRGLTCLSFTKGAWALPAQVLINPKKPDPLLEQPWN